MLTGRSLTACLLTLWMSCAVHTQSPVFPYCQNCGAATGNPPSLPPPLPDVFTTEIEANIIDRQYSILMREVFDSRRNMAALHYRAPNVNGSTSRYIDILNYNLSEAYYIVDDMCETHPLSEDPWSAMLGNGSMFSTSQLFAFGGNLTEVYKGNASVRGIAANHWCNCVPDAPFKGGKRVSYQIDYYFSQPLWLTDSSNFTVGADIVPLRAVVQGTLKYPNNNLTSFQHNYEYLSFGFKVEPRWLQTPPGVFCPGRNLTKPAPTIPDRFFFHGAVTIPYFSSVTNYDMWYDTQYKLARIDYKMPKYVPRGTDDYSTLIEDYNMGVSYYIDRTKTKCSIQGVQPEFTIANLNYSFSSSGEQAFFYQMKTPQQFFLLDNLYEYVGQRAVDSMMCDVYITQMYADFLNGTYNFEQYYLADSWKEAGLQSPGVYVHVPVKMIIRNITTHDVILVYRFTGFEAQPQQMTVFDISPCFEEGQRIDFQLTIPGQYFPDVAAEQTLFKTTVELTIAARALVSPIRVQKIKINYVEDMIYVSASLLDRAPEISKFHITRQNVPAYTNFRVINSVFSASDCAFQCLNQDFACHSFQYCKTSKTCRLSQLYVEQGTIVAGGESCPLYSLNVAQDLMDEVSLVNAYRKLETMIYKNEVYFTLPLRTGESKFFRVTGIRNDILLTADTTLADLDYIRQFTVYRNQRVKGNDDAHVSRATVRDCATYCVKSMLFVCESFEYCSNTGDCYYSKIHPDEFPNLIERFTPEIRDQGCDLYSRSYAYQFDKYEGQTALTDSDYVYQAITNENQCAKLCMDLQAFECMSFEFCGEIKACILGKSHFLDIPKTDIKYGTKCDHYSRGYIHDFTKIENKEVALQNNQIFSPMSLTACAKLCVEQSHHCRGFDYCGNTTMCRVTSDSLLDVGQVTAQPSAFCDHYSRQYYRSGTPVVAGDYSASHSDDTGYSAGSMAGLAFGMLLIGALMALGAMFLKVKLGPQADGDVKMSFSNKAEEP